MRPTAGHVRGRTGTPDDMFGLTGVTDELHGDRIVVTVFAEGTADPAARQEIDALAAALWRCGGRAPTHWTGGAGLGPHHRGCYTPSCSATSSHRSSSCSTSTSSAVSSACSVPSPS